MREIKFRAWTESDKSMTRPLDIGIPDEAEAIRYYGIGQKSGLSILEQFTGLRDKNGKEIYEGDIVSIEHILVYERTVSHPKRNAIMTWDEGETGFRLSSDSVKNTNPDIYPVCCLEVIGNIHENPELLK